MGIGITTSMNQGLGIIQSDMVSLTPSLSAILSGFFANLSSAISLVTSINQDLHMSQPITISLSSSANQGLGLVESIAVILVPNLSAMITGFLATLTTSIGISPAIDQDLRNVLNSPISVLSSINQGLVVGSPPTGNVFSIIVNLTGAVGQGVSGVLSSAITLTPSLNQMVTVFLSDTVILLSSLNAQIIGYLITLSTSLNISPVVQQGLGVVILNAESLLASLSAFLPNNFSAMFSSTITLAGAVGQSLSVLNFGSTNTYPCLTVNGVGFGYLCSSSGGYTIVMGQPLNTPPAVLGIIGLIAIVLLIIAFLTIGRRRRDGLYTTVEVIE
jgi:hypothetical protein